MNKGISKWPSRVLNLLVVLSMVIALCIVLAPPIVAEVPTCDPVEQFNGCNLEVFVNTYTKDANGDFTAVSQIEAGDGTGDTSHCFYVNAVVVNTGNVTAGNISAHIDLGAGMELATCDVGNDTKYWEGDDLDPTVPGRMADFWWKVCCIGTTDWQTISVTASAATGQCANVVGTARIQQIPEEEEECLYIEIIEAPGWAAPGYTETFPDAMVTPCTNFGIKALVRNECEDPLYNVNATIEWTDTFASLVGGDPDTWQLGTLYPDEERVVAWTLHCDGQGDVVIEVHSNEVNWLDDYGPHNPYTVEQFGAGDLTVEIISPEDGYEVCAGCEPGNIFPIDVEVTNNTGETVDNIRVELLGNDTAAWEVVGVSHQHIGSLAHGYSDTVTFSARCIAVGDVLITAEADGDGAVLSYEADPDTIVIYQKQVLASIQDYDTVANICEDPPFQIIGAYKNCSGVERAGVEVSIFWYGNATLILTGTDKPMFDRQQDGLPPPSYLWEDFASLNTNIVDEGGGWWSNTQTVVICPCCETLVRWRFDCTGELDVEAYTKINWTGDVGEPPVEVTYTDVSETVDIDQDWKAHLLVGQIAFLQGEGGCMFNRNAFVPGQSIHVVVPVVNVGQAEAQNVQITFKILGDTARWAYVSMSGDVTSKSWTEGTATGVATIPSIPGNSTKKLIVQLECTGPGAVQFSILSVTGTDGNSGAPIRNVNPGSNIIIPNCNLQLEQIPFTVTVVNPITCTTYNPGDLFGVKAVITNGSEDVDLNDVWATIHWDLGDPVALAADALHGPQQNPKQLMDDGNVSADSTQEITWELVCTGPGEVYLWVTAEGVTAQPVPLYISAESNTVNVHQQDCIDIGLEILSPDSSPNYEDDWDYTAIATGEEFAVTARVNCTGTADQYAQNVRACIDLPDGVALGKGEASLCKLVGNGTMETDTEQIVTWTLKALWTEETECGVDDARINVSVSTTSDECENLADPNTDYVYITIYPTAHLVAEIVSITPVSPFMVCEEFEVTYRVYNYGEADAWEVEAVLSVDPAASVRIAEGEGGYTRYLGTIAGWSYYGGGYWYVEDTFTLHCKQVCESTITITPKGNDECGWHTVFVQDEDHYAAEYEWFNYPGREIDPEFIEPVSQTVKQVEFVPAEPDTSITTYDIELVSGWNLISLPLIPDDSDIADAFATIWPNFNRAAMFDDGGFKTYIKGGGAQGFTTVSPEFGYWVLMNASDTLTVTGQFQNDPPSLPASYEVVQGWNLIGFHSVAGQTAGDYLAALTANGVPTWAKMWGYANGQWSPVGVNGTMNPGRGYWLAVTAADGGTIYP